jgi:hypothetical protein
MAENWIKKISVKNVCGKVYAPEKQTELMTVVGVCTGTRTGSTQYGDFTGLRGTFHAVNLETGEAFRSSQCFLADDVTDMITSQLVMEGVESVEFAFSIGVKPSDAPIGYEYTAKPLLEPGENDPLEGLMKRLPRKARQMIEESE